MTDLFMLMRQYDPKMGFYGRIVTQDQRDEIYRMLDLLDQWPIGHRNVIIQVFQQDDVASAVYNAASSRGIPEGMVWKTVREFQHQWRKCHDTRSSPKRH